MRLLLRLLVDFFLLWTCRLFYDSGGGGGEDDTSEHGVSVEEEGYHYYGDLRRMCKGRRMMTSQNEETTTTTMGKNQAATSAMTTVLSVEEAEEVVDGKIQSHHPPRGGGSTNGDDDHHAHIVSATAGRGHHHNVDGGVGGAPRQDDTEGTRATSGGGAAGGARTAPSGSRPPSRTGSRRSQQRHQLAFAPGGIFSTNMTLQREPQTAVLWGVGPPNATIELVISSRGRFRTTTATTTTTTTAAITLISETPSGDGEDASGEFLSSSSSGAAAAAAAAGDITNKEVRHDDSQEETEEGEEAAEWTLEIPPPYNRIATNLTFTLSSPSHPQYPTVTLRNVAFGDVYLCAGQSNMRFTTNAACASGPGECHDEVEDSIRYPHLRMMTVSRPMPRGRNDCCPEPQKNVLGTDPNDTGWHVSSPSAFDEVMDDPADDPLKFRKFSSYFSAVCYFYGRDLYKSLNGTVPIGLIVASYGGTYVQSWTRMAVMKEQCGYGVANDDDDHDGVGENRRDISASITADDVTAEDEPWDDEDLLGVGGAGEIIVKSGRGENYVREVDDGEGGTSSRPLVVEGRGVTTSRRGRLRRNTTNATAAKTTRTTAKVEDHPFDPTVGYYNHLLYNGWATRVEDEDEEDREQGGSIAYTAQHAKEKIPTNGTLYNSMIHPIVRLRLRAFLWYQGESNLYSPAQYSCLFPTMIRDWRSQFQLPNAPFYFVQLAPIYMNASHPGSNVVPIMRKVQETSGLALDNTGMVTAFDLGDATSPFHAVHTRRKQEVGRRLSLLVRETLYDSDDDGAVTTTKNAASSVGPTLERVQVISSPSDAPHGDRITVVKLKFDRASALGLHVHGSADCDILVDGGGSNHGSSIVGDVDARHPPRLCCEVSPFSVTIVDRHHDPRREKDGDDRIATTTSVPSNRDRPNRKWISTFVHDYTIHRSQAMVVLRLNHTAYAAAGRGGQDHNNGTVDITALALHWHDAPPCVLYNGAGGPDEHEGLPAVPFVLNLTHIVLKQRQKKEQYEMGSSGEKWRGH